MPMKAQREYRALSAVMEVRADAKEDEMIVEGYATTFNQPYDLFTYQGTRYMEQVDPNAFEECDMADVIMQYDHAGRVYARTRNGTLKLEVDDRGLKITADLSRTDTARQLYQEIKAGMTDRMSFGFIVGLDERTTTRDEDTGKATVLRTIKRFKKLYDVSAVSIPANDQTSISARTLSDGWIAEAEAERLRAQRKARLALKIKMMEGEFA